MPLWPRRACLLGILLLWILAGPLATILGGCAAMGAMCEGPCGAMSGALSRPLALPGPGLLTQMALAARDDRPVAAPTVPDVPPRAFFPSA